MTENIFIEQLRRGERNACQRLVNDYGYGVFQMVRRIVVQQEDAEEVYQDVFVKALQGIGSYDSKKASLATWINRIAYHEALNFVRRRHPNIVYMDEKDMNLGNIDETREEDIHDSQTIEALEKALEKLPPHEQAIVTMFYYDDMSLADIAYVTGSIPSTVGSQLCRIRKKLYQIIKTTHL
ncbi:MAG: sigma-70 family RNA polymerase sigma factor [Prevotella sp.]|nr:sigma-70 family RNA polymerase sigma factor [Prevotella sp.]